MLLSLTVAITWAVLQNMKVKSHSPNPLRTYKFSGATDAFSGNNKRENCLKGDNSRRITSSAQSSREGISENTTEEMCLKDVKDLAEEGRRVGGCVWNH